MEGFIYTQREREREREKEKERKRERRKKENTSIMNASPACKTMSLIAHERGEELYVSDS